MTLASEKAVRIEAGSVRLYAVLGATPTAEAIWKKLPLEGPIQRWGGEIYFEVPLELPLEGDARAEVVVGDIAFWPPGPAIAFFYGPTPASKGEMPAATSAVNVFGRISGDAGRLERAPEGGRLRLSKLEG